jgi:ABC-type uncharacterized transport system permease subunit
VLRISILICYLVAAWLLAALRYGREEPSEFRQAVPALAFGSLGLVLHGVLLSELIRTDAGPELSIANVFSLVGFGLALGGIVAATRPRLRGLGAVMLPVGAIGALASGVGEFARSLDGLVWEMKAHIAISVVAYTLLSFGALISLLIYAQDRALRHRSPAGWLSVLPPLVTMEQVLFTTIHAGVILLTLSVFSGLIFVENVFAQHLVHKTVLSIIALVVFGILLLGRWRFGWRGRKAIHWTLVGYGLLVLGYFGSRLVLEVLLQRQWG